MSEDQPKQQQKPAASKSEIFSTDKYAETLQNMWFHFLHSRSQHLHPDEYKESIYITDLRAQFIHMFCDPAKYPDNYTALKS